MLFNKNIQKVCLYCKHAKGTIGKDDVLCPYKGVVSFDFKCMRYKYDPLNRDVKRPAHIKKLKDEVFEL